jgi:hypothetical protein
VSQFGMSGSGLTSPQQQLSHPQEIECAAIIATSCVFSVVPSPSSNATSKPIEAPVDGPGPIFVKAGQAIAASTCQPVAMIFTCDVKCGGLGIAGLVGSWLTGP